jgi:hypothetical protein
MYCDDVVESYSALVEELYRGHVVSTDLHLELDEQDRLAKGK